MQAATQRFLSTFVIAIAGAAISLLGADARPAEPPPAMSWNLLTQVALAPR
jgi:hypothetical protein